MGATELWQAILNPSSPRYLEWRKVFDTDEVPLLSPFPIKANLNNELTMIHAIDWNLLDGETSNRLVAYIAQKFGVTEEAVQKQIGDDAHFPIRAADVLVTMSPKSFI
jgi:hypothetical protein